MQEAHWLPPPQVPGSQVSKAQACELRAACTQLTCEQMFAYQRMICGERTQGTAQGDALRAASCMAISTAISDSKHARPARGATWPAEQSAGCIGLPPARASACRPAQQVRAEGPPGQSWPAGSPCSGPPGRSGASAAPRSGSPQPCAARCCPRSPAAAGASRRGAAGWHCHHRRPARR